MKVKANTNTFTGWVQAGLAVFALLGASVSTFADFTKTVRAPVSMPVTLDGTITMSNNPGPQVTLEGGLVFGGLQAQAIFRNNAKGTHTYVDEFTAADLLMPAGEKITVPKQPVLGGTGGNPFVWLQLLDGRGRAMTGEIYLGRCVQGLTTDIHPAFIMESLATADAQIGCSNNPGPFITVNGDLALAGLTARFIFRNNDNPVGGPHEAAETVDSTLLAEGTTIRFPKQPVLGGVGGNPWIWLQFLYANGEDASDEMLLGRCVQDSK